MHSQQNNLFEADYKAATPFYIVTLPDGQKITYNRSAIYEQNFKDKSNERY